MVPVKTAQKNKIICHDCKKEIEIEGKVKKGAPLKNGKMLEYKIGDKKMKIVKCNECYEKDPTLRNFRDTEVYSRIVGYLRPVRQWNTGKKREYAEREVFKQPREV